MTSRRRDSERDETKTKNSDMIATDTITAAAAAPFKEQDITAAICEDDTS